MRPLLISLLFLHASAFAAGAGVAIDPNAPSSSLPIPPPEARPTSPPDCVKKVLEAIFDKEKAYFDTKKAYSDSLLEIRAMSAIGLGCGGWELPVIHSTYGGTGYAAVMQETASGDSWTINQDKALILEQKKVDANAPRPAK